MIYKNKKSPIFIRCKGLIIEEKINDSIVYLKLEYKKYPDDISLIHLLISGYILLEKYEEVVEFLRYEEDVSLYRAKLGFIRNIIEKSKVNLYNIGAKLLSRGWVSDANIYFELYAILVPDHDKTLIPLGENAIQNKQFQKGTLLFSKAAENYFKSRNKRGDYDQK